VPACLGADNDWVTPDKMRIYRQKCRVAGDKLLSTQQWDFAAKGRSKWNQITHRKCGKCLAVEYETSDWKRTGAAVQDEAHALLTVQHQPNTCLSCVKVRERL
jgi:hypothetical protein